MLPFASVFSKRFRMAETALLPVTTQFDDEHVLRLPME
jgi:hypothetical protein